MSNNSDDMDEKRQGLKFISIKASDDDIKQKVKKLESRRFQSTTDFVLNNLPAFSVGLIVGALIAIYIIWNEREQRKELKRVLIEYIDKTVRK